MDLTFQVPMQYCSLQHRTLLLPPVTSTAGYCFCFGSIPSFFLELFLHWSPVAYWTPTDLGNSYFSILSFCLFILFMGFSRQEYLAPSFGEGNGNPLQCSCLENPRDGGAWWAVVSGVAQIRTWLKQLSSSSSSSSSSTFFLDSICIAAAAKSLQSCPTLWDPMDCGLPDSSVHGIFQAKEYWSGVPLPSSSQSRLLFNSFFQMHILFA